MKLSVLALLTSLSASSFAAEFYIDPVNGSPDNDGSKEAPWRTLEEVFDDRLIESQTWLRNADSEFYLVDVNPGAPVKAGDTLILNSGYHGDIDEMNYFNTEEIVVTAGKDQFPQVSRIRLRNVSNWVFSGLSISPSHDPDQSVLPSWIVSVVENSNWPPTSNIHFLGNTVFTAPDASTWDAADWKNNTTQGFFIRAINSTIANNYIYNVEIGIETFLDNKLVFGNTVMNFTGRSAIRVRSDNSEVTRNLVANAISTANLVSASFYGINSFAHPENPEVNNVKIQNNWLIDDYYHPYPSLLANFRGIGMRSGLAEGFVVENNIIQVNNSLGIEARFLKNSRIVNNTLVDSDNDQTFKPSIRVASNDNNIIGGGNIVRNNVAHSVIVGEGTQEDHNLIIDYANLSTYFADRENLDLRPAPGSPLIGAGSLHKAPLVDIEGNPRIKQIDVGASQSASW